MALGKCPECDGMVSSTAASCPHCGNTKFRVPTGRKVTVPCPNCEWKYSLPVSEIVEMSRFGRDPWECSWCNKTRKFIETELKDLRDDSLYPKPR